MFTRLTGMTITAVLTILASSSFAAYTEGYTWDFKTLFGRDNDQPGLSMADSEGNRTYEYRYSWVTASPAESHLMGACFTWTDNGWRYNGDENWQTAILEDKLFTGTRWDGEWQGEAVQIHWTAPMAGYYNISITANDITKDDYSTQEKLWIKNMTTPVAEDNGPLDSWSYQTPQAVWLEAGEKVVFLFSGWGSNYSTVNDFNMNVTLTVPEPATLSLLAGSMLMLSGRKR